MRSPFRALALATSGSALLLSAASASNVTYDVRQVAHEGQDSGQGSAFLDFGSPVINSNGLVGFEARFDSGGFIPHQGVFTHNTAGLGLPSLVARNGMPAPGTDATFSSFFIPHLNNAAQIAGHFQLNAGGTERSTIYGGQAGALSLLAREGHAAPGPAGTVWRPELTGSPFSNDLRLNQAGQVLFSGGTRRDTPDGPVFGGGLYLGTPTGSAGPVQAVVSSDQPGSLPGGGSFVLSGNEAYLLNASGDVFLHSSAGYVVTRPGSVAIPVALYNQPSPIAGFNYLGNDSTVIAAAGFNNAGMVAFQIGLDGSLQYDPQGNPINNIGVFAGTPGDVRKVYQRNDLIPGAGNGDRFDWNAESLVMNKHGQLAFKSLARDADGVTTSRRYLMFGTPDAGGDYELFIAARYGDATGLDGGNWVFGEFTDTAMNGNGMYFTGFAHDNSTGQSRRGIWGFTVNEGLFPILAEGQIIEVEPGLFLPIDAFTLVTGSGGEDGLRNGINDDGELAVYLRFPGTGGSTFDHGVYVLTVPALAVPEPGSLAVVGLLGIPALLRRRR